MSSISNASPASAWGGFGAPDWRHAPAKAPEGVLSGPLAIPDAPAAGWFDMPAPPGAASLTADVGPTARGLSVQQHATRVLTALCG